MIQLPKKFWHSRKQKHENELWYHDVETEREKFPDGAILDLNTGKTSWGYLGDGKYAPNEVELNEQIVRAVNELNQPVKENDE